MTNTRYEIHGLHVFAPRPCKWALGVLYAPYVLGASMGVAAALLVAVDLVVAVAEAVQRQRSVPLKPFSYVLTYKRIFLLSYCVSEGVCVGVCAARLLLLLAELPDGQIECSKREVCFPLPALALACFDHYMGYFCRPCNRPRKTVCVC